jgi:hypothetical protein
MTEHRTLRDLSDAEIFELVKAGQESHRWTLGLYMEVERRGAQILDGDADLRSAWDSYQEERTQKLKAVMDSQVMPKLTESIRLLSDSNRAMLEKLSASILPPSFSTTVFQNLIPKIDFPKFVIGKVDFPKFEIPRFDYPKLGYSLGSEVVRDNPSLEDLPLDSVEVTEATETVLNTVSDVVGLLAQLVETAQLTAERVKPASWQHPVAIWTLVLTAAGFLATIVIAIVK